MQDTYVPILVEMDGKKELWRFDFSDLSITELSKIKEDILKNEPYTGSIVMLDKLIREKTKKMIISSNIPNKSYVKTYKENKKQDKIKKRGKHRRR